MSFVKNPADIIAVHEAKLKKIKCALFDVDGVLTDGRVFYTGEEVGWNRYFNIYDGYGIKRLMANNIKFPRVHIILDVRYLHFWCTVQEFP